MGACAPRWRIFARSRLRPFWQSMAAERQKAATGAALQVLKWVRGVKRGSNDLAASLIT